MMLQDGETVLHDLKPDPSVFRLWFFTKCIPASLVGSFLAFMSVGIFGAILSPSGDPLRANLLLTLVLGGLVSLVAALAYYSALRHTYRYWVTNMRCVFTGGILRRVERSAPYHKITDIELSQNVLERILKLSSIHIFTPGTASPDHRSEISFPGLVEPEEVVQTLNRLVRQSTKDI